MKRLQSESYCQIQLPKLHENKRKRASYAYKQHNNLMVGLSLKFQIGCYPIWKQRLKKIPAEIIINVGLIVIPCKIHTSRVKKVRQVFL